MKSGVFLRSSSGSVAVTMGIVAAVLFGAAGIAVDFVNASYIRTSLQHALDSAVLAASANRVQSEDEAEAVIHDYLATNWKQKFPELAVDVKPAIGNNVVSSTAHTTIPTVLSGVLGIREISINVSSTATTAENVIEVAMVIDNSTSMQSHLDLLRSSLLAVVETLTGGVADDDLRFAIVPYSVYVNVGTKNKKESWLSFEGVDKRDWDGCVGSRDYPLELEDADSTPIPVVATGRCNPTAMLPLTSDLKSVESWIEDLETEVDDTYAAAGLIWGMRALSEREPFDEGASAGKARKILIFLTDGYSTFGPSYPEHEDEDTSGDALSILAAQCASAKADGITVYTVAFGAAPYSKEVLRGCASGGSYAYEADGADDLVTAFSAIAAKLSTIYLSQ